MPRPSKLKIQRRNALAARSCLGGRNLGGPNTDVDTRPSTGRSPADQVENSNDEEAVAIYSQASELVGPRGGRSRWALRRMKNQRERMMVPVYPSPSANIQHAVSAPVVSTSTASEALEQEDQQTPPDWLTQWPRVPNEIERGHHEQSMNFHMPVLLVIA
jgi:hypothetical protein